MTSTSPQVASAAAEWFALLQEDEATESEFQQWQQWLNASPEHQQAYRDVERAWRLIGDAGMEATVLARSHKRARWWAMAATVAIGLAVTMTLYLKSPSAADFSTATAESRSVRLPDGSRVTLGAQSRLESRFDGHARRVVLISGEAFFEVVRDPARAFTVHAGSSEIRVLGTAFNVRTSLDRTVVSVTEGRVALGTGPVLSAGEQVEVDARGKVQPKSSSGTDATTWLQGRFEYRGEELRHVIADLNRYTDRRIELGDESLGSLRYSGTVFPDHLDEWLQGIGGALPVEVRERGERREIVRAP